MVKREVDYINCIPTPKQRKHAHSGFELVRNMMLAGVSVDAGNGVITTPAGIATLYINGSKASVREITTLRPKDILRVEYYDMPTGKYANDKAVMNYIVRNYTSGGYTQVDAMQGVGYLKGDYNLISKYSLGHCNVNLWAGSSVQNPKVYSESTTDYLLDNPIRKQESSYDTDLKAVGRYVDASISRRTERTTWMLRGGIEVSTSRDDVLKGSLVYTGYTAPLVFAINVLERDKTVKPSLFLYYNRNFKGGKSLECSLNGYYARNTYKRNNLEDRAFVSDVNEDYTYLNFHTSYMLPLPKENNLTFSLIEFLKISQDEYRGSSPSLQHLQSSESLFFVDYTKRWGRKLMLVVRPGVSFLAYKLRGEQEVTHFAPRFHTMFSWSPAKQQALQLFFALGNTFPTLNTVNAAEQQIDRVLVRRGNPTMDNSTLLGPALTYTLNFNKWSALLSANYEYMSNAIANVYLRDNDRLINTYSSNTRYHQCQLLLSATWKPVSDFNVKWDGGYEYYRVTGAADERLGCCYARLGANYFLGDFSLSASARTARKDLVGCQEQIHLPFCYDLSGEWSHGNLSVVVTTRNLFMQGNERRRSFIAPNYQFFGRKVSELDNSFASVKVAYSLDYGKKVNRSPKYESKAAESSILK
uniref:hypothetical protein n=1 Tax=Prevotella fusca TaxID=589436 RepID=UPI003FA0561A